MNLCPICGNMNLEECFDCKMYYYRCSICDWKSEKWRYYVSDNTGAEGGRTDG